MQRRTFILASASVAGGVAIGYSVLRPITKLNPLIATLDNDQFAITPYVIIDGSGVTVIAPRAEMGQGIHGTLATLVAEELDIQLADLRVENGPASEVYSNTALYPPERNRKQLLRRLLRRPRMTQLTGGQSSIRDAFVKMRKAGAAARTVLVAAAAKEFEVEPSVLHTSNGHVVHPDGTKIHYTRLAAAAADIEPPHDPILKPSDQWRQLGRSLPRVDMVGKCTGTARYAMDVRLPGMLHATVRLNPHIGGGVKSFDASKASKMRGFLDAIAWEDGIIVLATNTWYAMEAAKMIDVQWGKAPYPSESSAHRAALTKAIEGQQGKHFRNDGNVDAVFAKSKIIEGTYSVPYLAHATMEPMNAVAFLKDGELDIWAGNQNPTHAQQIGAKIAGVPIGAVRVHTTYMGGGFGRRLEMDFIKIAVHAARAVSGAPVKVTWSREADMAHDAYRPLATARFRGSISNARPVALHLELSSPSLHPSLERRLGGLRKKVDERLDNASAMGVVAQLYEIQSYRVTAYAGRRLLPVGWWRGVGETQNIFFHESAIDELAHAADADPLEMRLSLLDHGPSRAVLETVAEISNWGSALPKGHGRGVAYALSSGAATAQVVEVSRTDQGIRIEKIFAVVDVGIALDPRNIEAQVKSSILWGLCAAMHGEITVTDGRVDQSNFHDYPLLRMYQAPPIEMRTHESGAKIYGVGESGTPTAPPALGNAIFAATGQRIRELPFVKSIGFI